MRTPTVSRAAGPGQSRCRPDDPTIREGPVELSKLAGLRTEANENALWATEAGRDCQYSQLPISELGPRLK